MNEQQCRRHNSVYDKGVHMVLPDFALEVFEEPKVCKRCNIRMSGQFVTDAGLREDQSGALVFSLTYKCPKCSRRYGFHFTRPMDWLDLAIQIADWYVRERFRQSPPAGRKGSKKPTPRAPIAGLEIWEIHKRLDNATSEAEFRK